jgi:signal transduction histidine kinase/CheY-like chemotaxis protein
MTLELRRDGAAFAEPAVTLDLLHIEDSPLDAELLVERLRADGFVCRVRRVDSREAFLAAVAQRSPDLILSDYSLPQYDGATALEDAKRVCPSVPFVFVSGAIGEERAIETLRAGATDYVLKDRLERLAPAVRRALREQAERVARRAAEARLHFVARVSTELARSVDRRVILETTARLCVPTLGSWCAVVERDGDRPAVAAVMHVDANRVAAVRAAFEVAVARRQPPALEPARTTVHRHLDAAAFRELLGNVDAVDLVPRDERIAVIVLPVGARDRNSDAIVIGIERAADRPAAEDVELAEELARRAFVALENARLVDEARRERERAEQANRAKDEFLAAVSHEVRTPLNAILGWTRMLRAGHLREDRRQHALETIERNAHVQVHLIEDLLDISRIITGKLRLNVGPTDLAQVIDAALDAVRPAADAKSIRIVREFDPVGGHIIGDPERLQQVVWNLLSNAVKFTPDGGEVGIRLRRENAAVEISVRDSGKGISREFLPHVFERFRQEDGRVTRGHGGLGLGLAIVKHLVELHGGTIEAESEGVGRGATFRVRIPLGSLRAAPIQTVQSPVVAGPPTRVECPPELEGVRVLVLDDEDDARDLVKSMLEHCRAHVRGARSVNEAIGLLDAEHFDVVVSDVGMPNEDGYAFIRRVRALGTERNRSIPAVALTAYARAEDRTRAFVAGFNAHVTKPVEPTDLAIVVASLAGRYARAPS